MNKKIVTVFMVCIIALLSLAHSYKESNKMSRHNILVQIKNSYNDNIKLSEEYIESINDYLSKIKKDSEYYFIKGYLNYINEEYQNAIENFKLSKDKISIYDSSIVKIYTHTLLNKSLVMVNEYDYLVENCKIAFNYISRYKKYKNNKDLIWDNISVLLNSENGISESVSILQSYIKETSGLSKETKVILTSNLGSLYSFDYKYAHAMYCYLDAISIIDSNKNIKNANSIKIKILTNIGDINFILNDYAKAIRCYDKAIDIKIYNKEENARSKSIAYINKAQSYIDMKAYDKAIAVSSEINDILSYLDEDSKDDIEILTYNILALAYTYKHDFNEAEKNLQMATDLLKYDKVEFSISKDVFLSYSYAQYYKEQGMYDEALKIFDDTLQSSIQRGLGLEQNIYKFISEMYKNNKDFDNYTKYNEMFINEKDKNEKILKDDYMDYSQKLYETDRLKDIESKRKIDMLILFFIMIILILVLAFIINRIKVLKLSNFTDSMTNLYNRKYLDYYIQKNNKSIVEKELSVILLDIDYFKKYNDNYGHIKGDEIIKEVSDSLNDSIRKNDIAIRYGGEEMVLILPNTSTNEAEVIAKRICSNIRNKKIEHKYSEVEDILTVSIGIYTNKFSNNESIYNLIDKADQALYKSKHNGRNRYEIFYN